MKELLALIGAVCLLAGSASAYVTDAPHNETNNVSCGDCHTYSLWWQYSPATQSTAPSYAAIADAVCDSCHTQVGYPNKISHSFTSMADMHNGLTGTWSTKCVDCHDPHQQAQLEWLNDNATLANYLFLVTGTVDAVATDSPQAGETTITYNPAITFNNSAWQKTTDLDPSVLTWENKNKSSGRGLIFVHDTSNLINTYSIISADNSTIVLRGTPDAATINLNDTFGLIYGQLVKKTIETPNSGSRTVKFFDPMTTAGIGGFVDQANSPREGVCQVCHTLTDYWLQDGTVVDASRFTSPPNDHNSGAACTSCHDTANGFKPTNADHTFMASTGTTCANCHVDSEDVVIDTHNGVCNHCHTSPPVLKGNFSSDTGKWPSTPHVAGDCTDCHDANGPAPQDIAGDFTNHPNAMDHSGQTSITNRCAQSCHFHRNKDIITQIHTGNPVPSDPCVKCHTLTVLTQGSYSGNQLTAKGTYSGSGQLKGSAANGPGECTECHSTIATYWRAHPKGYTHEGQVTPTGTGLCVRCHIYDQITEPEAVVELIHAKLDSQGNPTSSCDNCHDVSNGGTLISLAASNGPGTCSDCHGSSFTLHNITNFKAFNHETSGLIMPEPAGSDPDCMACHNEDADGDGAQDMIFDIHTKIVFPPEVLPPGYNVCTYTCHDTQGYLKGSASGFGLSDPGFTGQNICSTCHADHTSGHPTHVGSASDPQMNGYILGTERCITCHVGDRMEVVHNNHCLDCHESTFRQGIVNLAPGLPDPATFGDADGHLDCIECHQALGNSFFAADFVNQKNHWKKDNHDGQVESIPGCASCHAGTPIEDIHWGSGLCATCHAQTGVLRGSASGIGTGKPPTENTTCQTCHGDFILHASASINPPLDLTHSLEVQLTQSCGIAGCHTESDLVNGLHDIQGCTTCHAPSGELVGSASGKFQGGDCTECHSSYFDGHSHGTNAHFVYQGADLSSGQPCSSCHDGSWGGILSEHNINLNGGCTTCHSSTRATLIDPAFGDANSDGQANVGDIIYIGGSTNYVYCINCHTNATTYGSTTDPHPVP